MKRGKNGGKSNVRRNKMKDCLRSARVDSGKEISINGKELSFCISFFSETVFC